MKKRAVSIVFPQSDNFVISPKPLEKFLIKQAFRNNFKQQVTVASKGSSLPVSAMSIKLIYPSVFFKHIWDSHEIALDFGTIGLSSWGDMAGKFTQASIELTSY